MIVETKREIKGKAFKTKIGKNTYCKKCGGKISVNATGISCCKKCGSYNYDKE